MFDEYSVINLDRQDNHEGMGLLAQSRVTRQIPDIFDCLTVDWNMDLFILSNSLSILFGPIIGAYPTKDVDVMIDGALLGVSPGNELQIKRSISVYGWYIILNSCCVISAMEHDNKIYAVDESYRLNIRDGLYSPWQGPIPGSGPIKKLAMTSFGRLVALSTDHDFILMNMGSDPYWTVTDFFLADVSDFYVTQEDDILYARRSGGYDVISGGTLPIEELDTHVNFHSGKGTMFFKEPFVVSSSFFV